MKRRIITTIAVAALMGIGAAVAIFLNTDKAGGGPSFLQKMAGAVGWEYEEPIDKVTGNKTYDAKRTVPLEDGGTAEMVAQCRELFFTRFASIEVSFFDRDGKPIDIDTEGFSDTLGDLRVSVAQGQEGTLVAKLMHSNEVQLRGLGVIGTDESAKPSDNLMSFLKAPFARVEFPLLNGQKPVIDLLPQDDGLRKMMKQCVPEAFGSDAPAAATGQQAPAQSDASQSTGAAPNDASANPTAAPAGEVPKAPPAESSASAAPETPATTQDAAPKNFL